MLVFTSIEHAMPTMVIYVTCMSQQAVLRHTCAGLPGIASGTVIAESLTELGICNVQRLDIHGLHTIVIKSCNLYSADERLLVVLMHFCTSMPVKGAANPQHMCYTKRTL